LGYLNPDTYAGGTLALSTKRAERAVQDLADEMDISHIEMAHLIKRKADANMANGISRELGVRGYDPRKFTILAYGGNGPLHCCGIATLLNLDRILVPPFSSVFSALGVGAMQQLHIHEKSVAINIYDSVAGGVLKEFEELNAMITELEQRGLDDLTRQGVASELVGYRLEFDMRYGNQLVQTSVVSQISRFSGIRDVLSLIDAFKRDYGSRFGEGSEAPEAGIRITTVRVAAFLQPETLLLPKPSTERKPAPAAATTRQCYFTGSATPVETSVFSLVDLSAGSVVVGPAVVEATTTTYLVEPGWTLTILDEHGAAWFDRVAVTT